MDTKVFKLEIVNTFNSVRTNYLQGGKGAGLTSQLGKIKNYHHCEMSYWTRTNLNLKWFYVVEIDVSVSKCVNKIPRL